MHSEKIRRPCILTFLLSFLIICVIFDSNLLFEISNINFENEKNLPIPNYSSTFEYSGVGAAQNVSEFGIGFFQNNEINITNSENASIIVPNNWEANEILCNVTNIYDRDTLWMNETFDNTFDNNYWSNNATGNVNNVSLGWYDAQGTNSSIYIGLNSSSTTPEWGGTNAHWNYTFYVNRKKIPYQNWYIDFNFRYLTNTSTWPNAIAGANKLSCKIYTNAGLQNEGLADFKLPKFENNYNNNTWYSISLGPFIPELYDLDLPSFINVIFDLNIKTSPLTHPDGWMQIFFDNITLKLATIPHPTQINLTITDNAPNGIKDVSIKDVAGQYGKGKIFLSNNWIGAEGGTDHEFSFSTNSSGKVEIYTDFFVNATSSKYTTIELGDKGSEFIIENGTRATWTAYFSVDIPGTYQTNYFFNLSKPTNWNVTHLFDPYGNDKISQVLETSGPGNSTLIIPNDIIVNGRWKIVAESPNYVLTTKIWKWVDDISWEESTNFETYDVIKINGTIDNDLIPSFELTNASLLIYYPNGTEWSQAYHELSPDSFGNVEFNNFTLGALNSSAGTYTITLRWQNQEFSQIGFSSLNFENIHNTILDRANDQDPKVTPIYTGDTILIKVNYTDIDVGVGIFNAYVNYTIDNETAITGDMIYFGGGIYGAEIDTTNWQNGLYNVSISANKSYYKPQFQPKLIQLEVTERTTLSSPQIGGVTVPWGSNKTIYISYNGSNNQGISGAIIDCDWDLNYYIIQEVGLGHYNIMLNTTIKTIDTYMLKINASKDGYENREIYIPINIRNIYTNITYIQPEPVNFNSNVSIQLKFGDIDSDILISGAELTISSEFDSQYWDSSKYFYFEPTLGTYNVTFNSSIFNGAGTFQIYTTLNRTYYSNASSLINIFIIDISTSLNLYLDGVDKTIDGYIERTVNQLINITVLYRDSLTKNHIENSSIKLSGGGISKNLTENSVLKHYWVIINTTNLNQGINFLTIYAQKGGFIPYSILFTVEINERETSILILLNGENKTLEQSIELPIRDNLNITIKYADAETKYHIENATVQLIGEDLSVFLMENLALEQYSITINTSQLDIGVRFLTIYAQKTNYQPYSALLSVNVKRINTEITTISGETTINTRPGQSVTLRVILKDLDFNQTVKNAIVTYSWVFGQGQLLDSNNDGLYEVILVNVHEGTHTITISVYAGDDYDFKRFKLTLNVVRYPEEALLFQILTVLGITAALCVGSYLVAYQRVLKYPKPVRKIHKYKSSLKKRNAPKVEILSRKSLVKNIYKEEFGLDAKFLKKKIKYEQPEQQPSEDKNFMTLDKKF